MILDDEKITLFLFVIKRINYIKLYENNLFPFLFPQFSVFFDFLLFIFLSSC